MNKNNLLIIFIKAPRLGHVKTRLSGAIGNKLALQFYQSMVEDLLLNFHKNEFFDVRIMFWPEDGRIEIQNWLGNHWEYSAQSKGDLGEKMQDAFCRGFQDGYKKIIIIGSDLPELTLQNINEAFAHLEDNQLVLGPTHDGGYYLIGLQTPQPTLFENIQWSSREVLYQTLKNSESVNLIVAMLPRKNDIDTYDDLQNFWNNFTAKSEGITLPKTLHTLKNFNLQHKKI